MALFAEVFYPTQVCCVVLLQCEKALLLDTGRMDAGDLFLDEILRVEMGSQGQGMILYGSEL